MYKISTANKSLDIKQVENSVFEINGKNISADIITLDENQLHIIVNHKSYTADLIAIDESGKNLKLKINGKIFELNIKDKIDLLLESMGLDKALVKVIKDIKAPMPGLVVSILVKEGDVIKKGEPLVALEAMKMENIIKSPADVVIKKINISKGLALEKGQVMIEFQ
jgi:biotin carboxyl carrier protein